MVESPMRPREELRSGSQKNIDIFLRMFSIYQNPCEAEAAYLVIKVIMKLYYL